MPLSSYFCHLVPAAVCSASQSGPHRPLCPQLSLPLLLSLYCLLPLLCHESIHLCHSSEILSHSGIQTQSCESWCLSITGLCLCVWPMRLLRLPTSVFLTVPLPFRPWIPFVRLRMFLSSNLRVLSLGFCVDFTSLPPSSPYKPCTVAGPSLQLESECSLLSCWLPPKPRQCPLPRLTSRLVARPWVGSTWLP